MNLITLTCPNCGGKLKIDDTISIFACAYCGTEHMVNRGNGVVSLKKVENQLQDVQNSLQQVQGNTARVAAELSLPRLHGRYEQAIQDYLETPGRGWFGLDKVKMEKTVRDVRKASPIELRKMLTRASMKRIKDTALIQLLETVIPLKQQLNESEETFRRQWRQYT